jgi:cyclopropane fatty-acyl-phospholipid synthase-like methyltransferase
MSTSDPVSLLFGGMEKLGPGSNSDTLHVLRMLPKRQLSLVVDAGCGTGRQTLALAKELGIPVHAVDAYEPFLGELTWRASDAKLGELVQTRCMDMKDIPRVFRDIDLLWSEGAAYNMGFSSALATWAEAIVPGGFAVVSELCWLKEQAPEEVKTFFAAAYPDMRSVHEAEAIARNAGFRVLATHTLPREAWVKGYYDILGPRAKALASHPDTRVRNFAAETLEEIEIFARSNQSYGYVFFVLERP